MRHSEYLRMDCSQYHDLWEREERRTKASWKGQPHEYIISIVICPQRKITSVRLWRNDEFIGAGLAIRNFVDPFYQEAGIRLALSRALSSVGAYNFDNHRGRKRSARKATEIYY